METSEYIVYTLLVLVLIAFVGIVGYVIYDNYNYKDNLTSDLNTNFKDINRNFNSTSNVINQSYNTHTSNLNSLSDKANLNDANSSNYVQSTSNILVSKANLNDANSSNYVQSTSNISFKNIDTFNYNLNKYFTFKETDKKSYSDANNKLFEYRTDALGDASRLELMTKTFATSGLQLNTITGKELGICNKDGANCFNVVNTADSLYIYKAGAADKRNIYIGGAEGAGATAPLKIVDGKVHITGELHINGTKYDPATFSPSGHTHQQPPTLTDATATAILGTIGKVGFVEVYTKGSGYGSTKPEVVIDGDGSGATAEAVLGTGTTAGQVESITITNGGSGYTSAPTITIAAPPTAVGGAAAGVRAEARAILVKPIVRLSVGNGGGSGYINPPRVTISTEGNTAVGPNAELEALVEGGKVSAVNLKSGNNGGSYTTPPNISFTRVA
jgi:hypothetical protein